MSLKLREVLSSNLVLTEWDRLEDMRPVVDCSRDAGMTRQSEAEACDINKIMARFDTTGVLPPNVLRDGAVFADVSDCGDYREALDRVKRADAYFMQLPAAVRAEFANDAAKFLDYVAGATRDELETRGWIKKDESPSDIGKAADAPPVVG